ncbi:hypothetical protein GCM10010218_45070 [Streptomyces mashuensis]|uniref:Uncharacterized protein n=1 Tax=Streptomyces mashuensis TaxID=33904 RepID=A0A919EEN2_9ACTN|nr:hypothetical protein [Streptomyces mashuensis]GHF58733.1 hypothetical protein GCM10010218_45070 [Streptomyces mashuensis]
MDPVVVIYALGAALITGGTRLVYMWLRGRITIRLTQLQEEGLNDRLRELPPGSRLRQRRTAGDEVLIEVGGRAPSGGWS